MLDEDLGFALNLSFSCLLRMKTSQFQELLHRQKRHFEENPQSTGHTGKPIFVLGYLHLSQN